MISAAAQHQLDVEAGRLAVCEVLAGRVLVITADDELGGGLSMERGERAGAVVLVRIPLREG